MNPLAIILVYAIGAITVFGLLVYLVIRRFKIKEEETFEKRDN